MLGVSLDPTQTGSLPGLSVLQGLTNSLAGFGLVLCLLAGVLGAVGLALGSSSSNAATAAMGKKTIAGAIAGAVLIGAAASLVNFFQNIGSQVH